MNAEIKTSEKDIERLKKTKIKQEYTAGTSLQKEVKLWERNHMQKEI